MITQAEFINDVNIGLYGFATDKYCLVGKNDGALKKALDVEIIETSALDTPLAKIFIAGNSSGIIVPKILEDFELKSLRKKIDKVLVLDDTHSCIGNLILMNDNGILVSHLLRRHKKTIGDFFDLPCEVITIAKMHTIGTLAIATNKGCLAHPKLRNPEKERIKKILGVETTEATVNFGTVHVGAGIITNSNGAVVGASTSGYELGAISTGLKLGQQ